METLGLTAIALGVVSFSLVSARAQTLILTPPMVFVLLGLILGQNGLAVVDFSFDHGTIHTIAEITLILVLFTDAARINLARIRADHNVPVRLLLIGMPLTIGFGALAAVGSFPSFSIWEAALLAAILTPTDAALGQAVVSSPKVPQRIRQALNVESGLNDGIALPIIVLFLCFANLTHQAAAEELPWLYFGVLQVTLGPAMGIAIGYGGARLIDMCDERKWMSETFQGIAALGLAVLAFGAAELVGGNGFIAAFVGGLVFGNMAKSKLDFLYEFAEAEGQLLTLIIFMIFGAALLPLAAHDISWEIVVYGVFALTLMRMVPVSLSLVGLKLHWPTHLFLGWFGPRGLASILFALLVVEEMGVAAREEILLITIVTVGMSVFAHGISASPGAEWYRRHVEKSMTPTCPENKPVSEIRTRIKGFLSHIS